MIQRNNKSIKHIYNGDAPKLPDEYQEVEYIHGDGTQYINTGYAANANIEINFKYKSDFIAFPSSLQTRCIIGGRTTAQNGISLWERDGNYQYGKNSTRFLEVKQKLENTDIHTVKISKGGDLYVDETKILTYTTGTLFQPNSYIYLFTTLSQINAGWTRTDNTDNRTMIGQFYYCIIIDNGVVVRHLIPCYRKFDDKPGMYDLVNNVFYTNVGTGEFTVGADVNYKKIRSILYKEQLIFTDIPDEYRRVEYLESSGTQYINTGWVNNQRSVLLYKMKFQSLALTESVFFGPYNSSQVRPGTLWLSVLIDNLECLLAQLPPLIPKFRMLMMKIFIRLQTK